MEKENFGQGSENKSVELEELKNHIEIVNDENGISYLLLRPLYLRDQYSKLYKEKMAIEANLKPKGDYDALKRIPDYRVLDEKTSLMQQEEQKYIKNIVPKLIQAVYDGEFGPGSTFWTKTMTDRFGAKKVEKHGIAIGKLGAENMKKTVRLSSVLNPYNYRQTMFNNMDDVHASGKILEVYASKKE